MHLAPVFNGNIKQKCIHYNYNDTLCLAISMLTQLYKWLSFYTVLF